MMRPGHVHLQRSPQRVHRCCGWLVLLAAGSRSPHLDPSDEQAALEATRKLAELGRLAHKERLRQLRTLYEDESVRAQAYAAFSEAAAAAAGKPEFGWLGREALVAKYGQNGADEMLAKARQAKLRKHGEAGLAELSRRGHAKAAAKDSHGAAGLSRKAGTAAALNQGKRVRYAGVRWQKRQDKATGRAVDDGRGFWRCSFQHRGIRYSVGTFGTEEEAAQAHDQYVIRNGLDRQLHFPQPEDDDGTRDNDGG